jgi:rhodanese-related sulfurtransferase
VTTSRIDALLADARRHIAPRVDPADLGTEMAAGSLVVDIRPVADRRAEGALPGAVVIERNVLEWRLDPTSDGAIGVAAARPRIVLVCNEGYASSLAAATLIALGLDATDLVGGYRAWAATVTP